MMNCYKHHGEDEGRISECRQAGGKKAKEQMYRTLSATLELHSLWLAVFARLP